MLSPSQNCTHCSAWGRSHTGSLVQGPAGRAAVRGALGVGTCGAAEQTGEHLLASPQPSLVPCSGLTLAQAVHSNHNVVPRMLCHDVQHLATSICPAREGAPAAWPAISPPVQYMPAVDTLPPSVQMCSAAVPTGVRLQPVLLRQLNDVQVTKGRRAMHAHCPPGAVERCAGHCRAIICFLTITT